MLKKSLFLIFLFGITLINASSAVTSSSYKIDDTQVEELFSSATEIDYDNLADILTIFTNSTQGVSSVSADGDNKQLIAGLLGIFCGSLGLHRFYLGHNQSGLIYLGVTLCGAGIVTIIATFTLGIGAILYPVVAVPWILGIVDGIMILTDETKTKYNDRKKLIMWMDSK